MVHLGRAVLPHQARRRTCTEARSAGAVGHSPRGARVFHRDPESLLDAAPAILANPGLCFIFLALAGLLSWTSARALGRQWRFDAGLNADHQLVQSGAYRFVRHPIYTSMLCLMLGTGFLIAPLLILAIATALAVSGTEIRVRIEDALLASRFQESFEAYRRRVPAYIPFRF